MKIQWAGFKNKFWASCKVVILLVSRILMRSLETSAHKTGCVFINKSYFMPSTSYFSCLDAPTESSFKENWPKDGLPTILRNWCLILKAVFPKISPLKEQSCIFGNTKHKHITLSVKSSFCKRRIKKFTISFTELPTFEMLM